MKIIDSFIFYNELDLLFYRLSILYEHVDYFILVESRYTFAGHPKSLYYDLNKNGMFSKFQNKMIHIIIDEFPYILPNINYQMFQQWENEYYQRNYIKEGINQIMTIDKLNDDDIFLTSDVDEIPNPNILIEAKNNNLNFDKVGLNRLALDMYYYNLYYRIGEGSNWHGIKLFTWHAYKNINLTFQQMRIWEHSNFVPIIPNGGWHLSYFGDIEFIIKKMNNFSHQEFNNEHYLNNDTLKEKIKNGINILNDSKLIFILIEENSNLPYQYDIYLKKFYI
jgi:beta-1,4-mannosyl-glycoprotein beta-1,4-N-acetylglucosaminyltransferase